MEQSSLERTVHRIPALRSNVAGNKTRLHGRQRVTAYCRVSTDSEEQINSYTAQKAYYTCLLYTSRQLNLSQPGTRLCNLPAQLLLLRLIRSTRCV